MERDYTGKNTLTYINISTHTLTWSVTTTLKGVAGKETISTHTLTWSVTAVFARLMPLSIISTHTLTWSVTNHLKRCSRKRNYFNSHAHVERDKNGIQKKRI